jgi:hypothetical protein
MRNSQRVIAGLLGAIVALLILAAIWIRIAVPQPPALSGERATRAYDFAAFRGVEVNGQWQVTIERGDAWRVAVEAPAELGDNVRVRLDGDALELGYDGRWWFGDFGGDDGLEATVTMPALESLEISGSSRVRFSGFEGGTLSLEVSGAGDVRGAASRYDALTLDMSGAGNLDLGDVTVTDADIDVSGAGNVTLRMAGGRLTGDMSGAGNLQYFGTVSEQSVESSGFVNIRQR